MSKTKVDPYGAECSYCKAPVGFNCTYVHPKFWTPDSQRRFFNNQTTENQIKLLKQVGEYTKQPHMVRFIDARKAAEEREMAKTVNWARMEPRVMAQREKDDGYQPMLSWDYSEPDLTLVDHINLNGVIYRSPNYIDKVLKEARAEWEVEHRRRAENIIQQSWEKGVEYGKKVAINLIATGTEDGR